MECILCFNFEFLISIIAIIIGLIAMLLAYLSFRYQIITLIHSQLAEKAKEANSYINSNLEVPVNENHKISLMLASIITASQILEFQLEKYKFLNISKLEEKSFIHIFHLQLNTPIRTFIGSSVNNAYPNFNEDIHKHLKEAYNFLKDSIEKYDKSSI